MVDHSAVHIAQQCHMDLLRTTGALDGLALMEYGAPLPHGEMLAGLYIDDLFACYIYSNFTP